MKTIVMALMLFLGVSMNVVVASPSHVVDQGGLFSNDEQTTLNAHASDGKYEFFVQTLQSYNGKSQDDVAANLFAANNLSENDVLFVLVNSKTEKGMTVKVKPGSDLNRLFDQLPKDFDKDGINEPPMKEFIDRFFIPYAKEGKFVDGIIQMENNINHLDSFVVNEAVPQGQAKTTHNVPKIFLVLGEIVLGMGLVVLAILTIQRIRVRNQVKARHKKVLGSIREWIANGTLMTEAVEKEAALTTGATNKDLQEFLSLFKQTNDELLQFDEQMENLKIPFFSPRRVNRILESIEKKSMNSANKIEKAKQKLQNVKELSKTYQGQLAELENLVTVCAELQKQIVSRTGMDLAVLNAHVEEIRTGVQKGKDEGIFDPLRASQDIKNLTKQCNELYGKLNKVEKIQQGLSVARKQDIPALEKEIDDYNSEKQLHHEEEIRNNKESVKKCLEQVDYLLIQGEIEQAEKSLETAISETKNMKTKLVGLVLLRDKNEKEIKWLEEHPIDWKELKAAYEKTLQKVRDRFVDKRWEGFAREFETIETGEKTEVSMLNEAKEKNSNEEGLYQEAEKLLKKIQKNREQINDFQKKCSGFEDALLSIVKQSENEKTEAELTLQKANRICQSEGFPMLGEHAEQLLREWEEIRKAKPLDVDELTMKSSQMKRETSQILGEVQEKAEQKARVEKMKRKVKTSYSGIRFTRSSSSQGSYQSNLNEVDRLMALGLYADALNRLENTNTLVREMEDEQKRYERESYSSSSSSSWDTSSSSDSSSGSSSWDSGSSSSDSSSGSSSDW